MRDLIFLFVLSPLLLFVSRGSEASGTGRSPRKVLRPILAGVGKPKVGRKAKNWNLIDEHYETIRQDVFTLFQDLRIAA